MNSESWPELPYEAWSDTCDTLHMWTQVVGKVSLALAPFLNEYWQVAFRLTGRGMSTGLIPYARGMFEVRFDFVDHELTIETTDGDRRTLSLEPQSVAEFYRRFMAELDSIGVSVTINTLPTETPNPVRFEEDDKHSSYDPEFVNRWWHIQVETERVLQRFRSSFVGKSSPIQFFWGSFDLTHVRFSGDPAPALTGVPNFFRLSEDQENFACGFWPGNATTSPEPFGEPAFYAYMYPAPEGLAGAAIQPDGARYDHALGEFILPYEVARTASDPGRAVLIFFESTYAAAADLAGWDRERLEKAPPQLP